MGKLDEEKLDARMSRVETRVHQTFKFIKGEAFAKSFRSADNRRAISEFLDSTEVNSLLIYAKGSSGVTATHSFPKGLPKRGKVVYFLKQKPGTVSEEMDELLAGEMSTEPLLNLEKTIKEVYMPILGNPANQQGWGEVAAKDILDKMHGFLSSVSITLGQTKGKTCLPLPVTDISSPAASGSGTGSAAASSKDKVHILEGAVIVWTKQIKNVLKLDPENMMQFGAHPKPSDEIKFWKNKADNLNSIFDQLQDERFRKVLRFLDTSRSTYCAPFAKLVKEVFNDRLEANDNVKFLAALEKWFDRFERDDFVDLTKIFKPILLTILLIWQHSQYYNVPARLVVLIREICNQLIERACQYISGRQVFELIADQDNNGAATAVEKLKTTLKVCGMFKSVYFDYKALSANKCPDNFWKVQNNALFMRLDAFLERCHDILDLTQTIVEFETLRNAEIGGTKGKTLTTSVEQIFTEFQVAVRKFEDLQYDIMDVGAKQFDDDFYDFRCSIKDLERRLGSVLTQGFDDAPTVRGRFKLLDSFDALLRRPIIQDELENKHAILLRRTLQI